MKKKDMKSRIFTAFVTIGATFAISSCAHAPQEQHTSFETLTLSMQNIEVPVNFSASIEGKNDVSIIPQISGQLTKVCVAPGQKVRKGDVLFKIDDRRALQALNAAQADLMAAEAQCNSAKLEYESNKNLFEKKIVSSYMLDTSLNDYNRATAAVAQARAAVESARLDLSFCTITSPVNGMVGNIPNNPGDMVSDLSLLTIISGNTVMDASFSIPENLLKEIIDETGSIDNAVAMFPEATLIMKDGTEYAHKGKVVNISGVVDKATGSVTCDAHFPNPDGSLFSGIQGNVRMYFSFDDVIIVPLTSVVRVQDKAYVYRVKDNCAESVIVNMTEVGNGKDAIIEGGVAAGDVIVAKGATNVYEGQQVIFPAEDKEKRK